MEESKEVTRQFRQATQLIERSHLTDVKSTTSLLRKGVVIYSFALASTVAWACTTPLYF